MRYPERLSSDFFFVNLEFFVAWRNLLRFENTGKVGAPFAYPEVFFDYLGFVRARTGLDYRGLESWADAVIVRGVAGLRRMGIPQSELQAFRTPHFTQIRRRTETARFSPSMAARLSSPTALYVLLDVDGPKLATPLEWKRVYLGSRVSRGWFQVTLDGVSAAAASSEASGASPSDRRAP